MNDVCREFGISRKTGYEILARYKDEGSTALTDRSRRPVRYANQLPPQIEDLIVSLKRGKPHWGARKIRELHVRRLPGDLREQNVTYVSGSDPRRHLERAKGFEPSTPTLARLCSTPELRPRSTATRFLSGFGVQCKSRQPCINGNRNPGRATTGPAWSRHTAGCALRSDAPSTSI